MIVEKVFATGTLKHGKDYDKNNQDIANSSNILTVPKLNKDQPTENLNPHKEHKYSLYFAATEHIHVQNK